MPKTNDKILTVIYPHLFLFVKTSRVALDSTNESKCKFWYIKETSPEPTISEAVTETKISAYGPSSIHKKISSNIFSENSAVVNKNKMLASVE